MQPEHIVKGYCPRLPGERLPASYINHYVANGGVVVPQFGGYSEELDAVAIKILQKAYGSDRKVVGVYSREVLLNAGNVHCITQQNPAPISDAKAVPKQPAERPAPSGGFFDSSVGSQNGSRTRVLTKAARNQAAATEGSSGGFFDNSVGAEFANRSVAPKKAAPKQSAPRKASSAGFFDNSVGSEFANRSVAPKKAAPKQAAPRKASSGGFFESSVGAQFANRSESPKKAAPTASAAGKLLIVILPYSKFVNGNILCKR